MADTGDAGIKAAIHGLAKKMVNQAKNIAHGLVGQKPTEGKSKKEEKKDIKSLAPIFRQEQHFHPQAEDYIHKIWQKLPKEFTNHLNNRKYRIIYEDGKALSPGGASINAVPVKSGMDQIPLKPSPYTHFKIDRSIRDPAAMKKHILDKISQGLVYHFLNTKEGKDYNNANHPAVPVYKKLLANAIMRSAVGEGDIGSHLQYLLTKPEVRKHLKDIKLDPVFIQRFHQGLINEHSENLK